MQGSNRDIDEILEKFLRGRSAIVADGMPLEFANQIMLALKPFGITITFRANKPIQDYDQPTYPKPSDSKEKTSDWGFAEGRIPTKLIYGKYLNGRPVNEGVKPSARTKEVQNDYSLRRLLKGLDSNPPKFKLLNDKADISKTHSLLIECLDSPHGQPITYRINLNNGKKPVNEHDAHIKTSLKSPRNLSPEWWPDSVGHFSEMIDDRFPVEAREDALAEFEPQMVRGMRLGKTDKLAPIERDNDLWSISRPDDTVQFVSHALDNSIPLFDQMNLNSPDDVKEMKRVLLAFIDIDSQPPISEKDFDDEKLSHMGCITPFKAYVIIFINKQFREYAPHLGDLIQHGCESDNPGKPTDISNARFLNFTNGMAVLTDGLQQQIEYSHYVVKKYGYQLEMNPRWDMSNKVWGSVVESMHEKGVPINDTAYQAYLRANQPSTSEPMIQAQTLGRHFSLPGLFRRLSNSPLARKLSGSSSPPRKISAPPATRRRSSMLSIFESGEITDGPIVQLHLTSFDPTREKDHLTSAANYKILAECCVNENNHTNDIDGVTWSLPDKNSLYITYNDSNAQGACLLEFRIEGDSISLLSGDVNEHCKLAMKKLHQLFFKNKNYEILGNKAATKLIQDTLSEELPKSPKLE